MGTPDHIRSNQHSRVELDQMRQQAALNSPLSKSNANKKIAELDITRGHKRVQDGYVNQNKTESLGFADLLDVINPLQHIPVISTAYRALTGDEISDPAKFAGASLYMGPAGAVASMVNIAIDELTGGDVGEHVVALFTGEEITKPITVAAASVSSSLASSATAEVMNATTQQIEMQIAAAQGAALPAGQEFSFTSSMVATLTQPGPAVLAAPVVPVASFNNNDPQAVAVESLPADILAALYSGQPMNTLQNQAPDNAQQANAAPLWAQELFASPAPASSTDTVDDDGSNEGDGDLISSVSNSTYGGVSGAIPQQGGWFTTLSPEILAKYQSAQALQQANINPVTNP